MQGNPVLGWVQRSFGFKSAQNVLAWGVAGGVAYFFWVLPEQREAARRKAIVEEWKEKYKNDPIKYPGGQASLKAPAPAAAPASGLKLPEPAAK